VQVVNRKMFPAGQQIFKSGDPAHQAYLIQIGEVEISRDSPSGKQVLAKLGQNAIFGEMALIDGKPRSASATALVDTTLIIINKGRFENLMETADPFLRGLLKVLAGRLRTQ